MKTFIRFSALLLIISFFGLNKARALETVTKIWKFSPKVGIDLIPAVSDNGTIYYKSIGNAILSAINFDRTKKWKFSTNDSLFGADKLTNIKTIYTILYKSIKEGYYVV